jgi:hypothetical protein
MWFGASRQTWQTCKAWMSRATVVATVIPIGAPL